MKNNTHFIAVQVVDLGLKTDIETQKAILNLVDAVYAEGEEEYQLQDLTIDELFCTYNANAGYVRSKDGVDWKVYPIYERNLKYVTIMVSWIQSDLKYFEFDVIEEVEGGQNEV